MEISEKEKAILQRILTDDAFDIMNRVASAMLSNWNKESLVKETEYLTVVEAVGREERKKALTSFFKTIETLARHD